MKGSLLMVEQINLFDSNKLPFKINKPIRLIELFAGIGTQAMAMKRAGIEFEHYRVVEIDKYAVASYNAIHGTDFKPTDIKALKGEDLGVKKDDHIYFTSYSFPCVDISICGHLAGMQKGSGTRSGLLWEVERLLNEMEVKPTVLMMENVPQILSKRNINDFKEWIKALEDMGYSNYYSTLNSKDFNVPQNRSRTFMFSFLGDYSYTFPLGIKRERTLQDLLEKNVSDKYFLSDAMVNYILASHDTYCVDGRKIINREVTPTVTTREGSTRAALSTYVSDKLPINYDAENVVIGKSYTRSFGCRGKLQNKDVCDTLTASMGTGGGNVPILKIKNCTKQGYLEATSGDGCYISNIDKKRGTVQKGMTPTLKTSLDIGVVVEKASDLHIRKLTPKECWRLMGVDDEDFEKARQVVSDTQLYKQAGNAIVVDVMVAMFKQMI